MMHPIVTDSHTCECHCAHDEHEDVFIGGGGTDHKFSTSSTFYLKDALDITIFHGRTVCLLHARDKWCSAIAKWSFSWNDSCSQSVHD